MPTCALVGAHLNLGNARCVGVAGWLSGGSSDNFQVSRQIRSKSLSRSHGVKTHRRIRASRAQLQSHRKRPLAPATGAPWACLAAPNKRSSQVTSEGRCCCCQRRAPPPQRGCDRRAILSLWRLDVFCGKDVPTWLLSSRTQTPARSQPPAAAPSGPGPGAPTSTSAPGQAPLCRWWPGGQSRVPRPPEAGVGRWRCGQFLCSLRQHRPPRSLAPGRSRSAPGPGGAGAERLPPPKDHRGDLLGFGFAPGAARVARASP